MSGASAPTTQRKMLIPLENNPTVLTSLSHTLGLPPTFSFHDIYTLHPPYPRPSPAHALILIVPAAVYHRARDAENESLPAYDGSGAAEPVLWFKQTIGNACGFMSVLHALANGEARKHLAPGSILERLIKDATPLRPAARAQLLYDSSEIEAAHMAAAQMGDSVVPSVREYCGFHFITFVKGGDGRLWELNGGMKGPVDRGVLGEGEDVLSESAVERSVGAFLKEVKGEGVGEVGFSVVALAGGEGQ